MSLVVGKRSIILFGLLMNVIIAYPDSFQQEYTVVAIGRKEIIKEKNMVTVIFKRN